MATEIATSEDVKKEEVGAQIQSYIKRDKAILVDAKQESDGSWTVNAEIPKRRP